MRDSTNARKDHETVLSDLFGIWGDRDERYTIRRYQGAPASLTPAEITAVQGWRRKEALELTGTNQKLALMAVERWNPPAIRTR